MTETISRREFFYRISVVSFLLAVIAVNGRWILELLENDASVADLLDELEKKSGTKVVFTPEDYAPLEGNKLFLPRELNTGEAKLIAETISASPTPGILVPVLLPVMANNAAGDQYPGGFFVDSGQNMFDQSAGQFADTPLISLILPENLDLQQLIDPQHYNQGVIDLLIFQSTLPQGFDPSPELLRAPAAKDHAERVRRVIVHESGHSLLHILTVLSSKNPEEYKLRKKYNLGHHKFALHHPIIDTFAKLQGWVKQPYGVWLEQNWPFAPDDPSMGITEQDLETPIYVRDPQIWGTADDPLIRLGLYADLNTIEEAFCEYYQAAVLGNGDLTPEEKRYFARLIAGLNADPRKLFLKLKNDPGYLLRPGLGGFA